MTTFEEVKQSTSEKFEWRSLESEEYREYEFPGGGVIRIAEPVALSLTTLGCPPGVAGGSHRIVDAAGRSHYIPRGWLQLTWEARGGSPHFDF